VKTNYENSIMHFRLITGGHVRVGADGQLVHVETHTTAASSRDAHEWIDEHVVKADRAALKRLTYPPDAKDGRWINREREA